MNILPKKRWHVRTKENIARVRKDEAEAEEKERQEKLRIDNADREARLGLLKHKSKKKLLESGIEPEVDVSQTKCLKSDHINLFENYDKATEATNKDHDLESKRNTEEYEKKIGYLTYLGQDTNEALKKKNWYEVAPETSRFSRPNYIKDTYEKLVLKDKDGTPKAKESDERHGEIAWNAKQYLDPLKLFKKNLESKNISSNIASGISINKKGEKTKKGVNDHEKKSKIQILREARLKREKEERLKTDKFLKGTMIETVSSKNEEKSTVRAKYNSQFNPQLARQNYK